MKKILLLLCFVVACLNVRAANYYWISTTGTWSVLSNWKTGSTSGPTALSLPTDTDDVYIGAASGNPTLTLDANYYVNNLFLTGAGQIFINSSAKTLTVGENVSISNSNATGGGTAVIRMLGGTLSSTASDGHGKLPNLTFVSGSAISLSGFITLGGSSALIDSGAAITAGTSTMVFYYNNTITCPTGGTTLFSAEFQGNSGTFVVNNTLTLNGNLTLSGSAYAVINAGTGAGAIKIDSDIISTNTHWATGGTGTMVLEGSKDQHYSYSANNGTGGFSNLIINKTGGTVTAASGTTYLACSSFTLTAGTFTAPVNSFFIGDNSNSNIYTIFAQSGGTFNHNNGTVVFKSILLNGVTYTVDALSTQFNNVTIDIESHTTSNAFITVASGDTIRVGGNFTHKFGGINGLWEVKGNLAIDGSGLPGGASGNIILDGSGTSTYSYTGGLTCGIIVKKSAGDTLKPATGTKNLNVTAFSLVSGKFLAPADTLYIGYLWDVNITLFNQSGGTFLHHNGTVLFNPTGDESTLSVAVLPSTLFYNFISYGVIHGHLPIIAAATGDTVKVTNNFTLNGGFLTGIWSVGGNLTINSGYNTGGANQIIVSGSGTQTFSNGSSLALYTLTMNKSGGSFTLNSPMIITNSLQLTSGIITSGSNLLTLNNGATVTGASSSSFVTGAVEKIGNAAFKFPVGYGTTYKPISISAPSTTTDAYTAQYYNTGLTNGLDGVLTYADPCEYWSLAHTAGSGSAVHDTLFWNSPCFHIASLSYFKIGYVSGSTLTSAGTCTTTGNTTTGSIAGVALGNLTLAKTNPLVTAHAGNDTAVCSGLPATLHGSVTGGTSPFTYAWAPATGLRSTTGATPTATPTVTTTYILTVTDNLTEYGRDTMVVTVHPKSYAHAGRDSIICVGMNTTIGANPTATGGTSPFSYSWTPSGSITSSTITQPIASPTVTTTYILSVTDANMCSSKDTMILTVNNSSLPTANAGNDYTVCNWSHVRRNTCSRRWYSTLSVFMEGQHRKYNFNKL